MPHINVHNDLPGIRGLMAYRPETAAPLNALAEALLRDETGLTCAERELIAARVSYRNDCFYCHNSHGEIACYYLGNDRSLVNQVKENYMDAPISAKLKSLLQVADKVQLGGKEVSAIDIENARNNGATDRDIHDTVLIAAAFCMFNRYVDGLAASTPMDLGTYPARARQVAEHGYGSHIYQSRQPMNK